MNPQGLRVSTPTDTTIVLTRTFDAPRRLVWEAMTVPARMRRWMIAPPEWTLTVCECDARVGGALHLAWKTAEADPVMTLRGEFTEVVPHVRMIHTETMALGTGQTISSLVETHEFDETNGVTRMRITQQYESKAARDEAVQSGMEQGMEAGYQRMDAMFAQSV